jgi:hypothetical protein
LAECQKIAKEVRTAVSAVVTAPPQPQAERIAAEQPPENPNPDLPEPPAPEYSFSILQLKDIPENRDIRFAPLSNLEDKGISPNADDYNLVYTMPITEEQANSPQLLSEVFMQFNINAPEDFKGHSLSVSDVIVVQNGEDVKAHYCDKAGFKEMPDFIAPEPEKAVEKEYPPVYLETIKHAAQNDEKPLYRESMQLNEECAAALDKAIHEHRTPTGNGGGARYDFDTALAEVVDKFGTERVNAVLAHVVNSNDFDGRLSQQNKDWANTVDIPQVNYIEMNTHLTVLDGFVNHVRKSQELEQSQNTPEILADDIPPPPPPETPTIAERPPTVAELETAVNNGETISVMDLATAVKNEKAEPAPDYSAMYEYNYSYAVEHGEIEHFNMSVKLDTACAAAIELAIEQNSSQGDKPGTRKIDMDTAVRGVIEEFGADRVSAVVGHVIFAEGFDGEFSKANKEWSAETMTLCQSVEINAHSKVIDGFAKKIREVEKELTAEPKAPPKASIKGRIATDKAEKTTAGKPEPTKQKNKGEAEI